MEGHKPAPKPRKAKSTLLQETFMATSFSTCFALGMLMVCHYERQDQSGGPLWCAYQKFIASAKSKHGCTMQALSSKHMLSCSINAQIVCRFLTVGQVSIAITQRCVVSRSPTSSGSIHRSGRFSFAEMLYLKECPVLYHVESIMG